MEWDVDDEELKNLWEEILNDEDLASDVTVTIECPDSYHQMSCDEVCDEAQNLIYSIERKTGIDDLDFDMYY